MPTGRRAPDLDRTTVRRFWVVVLASLCVVVAAQAGPWRPTQRGVELPPELTAATPAPDVVPDTGPEQAPDLAVLEEPPPDLTWVRRAVVVALAAVLLVLLVRWALRRQLPARPPPSDPLPARAPVAGPGADREPDLRVLTEGARDAVRHLTAAASPADAVIAAWVALEDAAARSGVTRERSSTATEFALDVLDRTAADPAAARILLALYLRARFDDQPLLGEDVDAAARAAGALLDTVGGTRR
jgi:Domain of unknown function (DUF4129)